MAGGVDHIYPPENAALAAEIAEQGLRLSEHPIGLEPQARHFPARNRIVSGLSLGVLVIEAAERSGSLITARAAADQGREVMAVPGHPLDPRAAGCNLLLRDGATLIRSADDVAEALGPALARHQEDRALTQPSDQWAGSRCLASTTAGAGPDAPRKAGTRKPTSPGAGPGASVPSGDLRARILDRLSPSPIAEDQLIRDLGQGAAAVAPALTDLELDGLIIRQPGGLLSRAA